MPPAILPEMREARGEMAVLGRESVVGPARVWGVDAMCAIVSCLETTGWEHFDRWYARTSHFKVAHCS